MLTKTNSVAALKNIPVWVLLNDIVAKIFFHTKQFSSSHRCPHNQ